MKSKVIFAVAALVGALAIASDANAGAALTTGAIKLLDGPIRGSALVATLPVNTRVGVLWCGMQKQWCLVSFHAKQGFVSANDLQLIGGAIADANDSSGNANGKNNPTARGPHTPASLETAAQGLSGSSGSPYQVATPPLFTFK